VKQYAPLLSRILIKTTPINSYLVSQSFHSRIVVKDAILFCSTVEKYRVILSGEFPDYIHAVSANVNLKNVNISPKCMLVYVGLQAPQGLHHS
jgi:hypothetical protein